MSDEGWVIDDRRALALIMLTLAPTVAFNIVNDKMAKGLMAALCNMYEKPLASNKVYLMRQLFNLKMTESQLMDKHLNEFNTIMTQLQSVGIDFDDEIKALLILLHFQRAGKGSLHR